MSYLRHAYVLVEISYPPAILVTLKKMFRNFWMTLRLRAMIFVYIFLYICGICAKEEIKSHEMKEHYDALTQHEKWVEKTDNGRKRSYIIVDSNANANPYSDHNPDNPYNYNPRLLEELEQARKASEEQMYLLNSTSSLLSTSDALFVEADLKEELRSNSRRLAEALPLLSIPLDPALTLYVEPPDGKLCSSLSLSTRIDNSLPYLLVLIFL